LLQFQLSNAAIMHSMLAKVMRALAFQLPPAP